ncbi:MAG TPA: hypothetical protein VMD05_05085 [Candidatus Nanoarchaeia archaeon]|nr:hypothetical protein [Candidatus Nanoarchaeia archaeon]
MKLKLIVFLALVLFLGSMLILQQQASGQFIWRDDFNYANSAQLQAAGWQITQNPAGVTISNGTIVLDGTTADTAIAYDGHFQSGITNWRVEVQSVWLGQGHSGAQIHVDMQGHSYAWATDGWYNNFAFYKDGQKILTFGNYTEQPNAWVNMTLEKQGNTVNMYYDGQLEKTYIETDQNIVNAPVQGVSEISPWLGNQAYEYYQLESIDNAVTTSKTTSSGVLTFKGWIDGTDYLYLQDGGATIWYQHEKSEIPGYEINGAGVQGNYQNHQNLPTYIDGNTWYPSWPGITTAWIDVPAVSTKYINPDQHPTGEWNITTITNTVARGNFSIIEYPSSSNNYTAKILLDDILPSGADWYSFTLNWETQGPISSPDITKTAWVPPPANGAAASIVTVGAVSIAALLAAAASSVPTTAATSFIDRIVSEVRKLLPDTVKKWLEDFIASKRKLKVDEKTGSPYLPTKSELIVYSIAVILLTLSFSYVKISNLNELLIVLPTFFATSILVALVRTYILAVYARRQGVWTEYKIWYFGVTMFLISTLAFRAPFSSPTRTVHHHRNFTDRLGGFLSLAGVLITLAFAGFFFILLKEGLVLIGGTGLAMCIISAFFDTFPLEPMGGSDIYKYSKRLWTGLFIGTLLLYAVWLTNLL